MSARFVILAAILLFSTQAASAQEVKTVEGTRFVVVLDDIASINRDRRMYEDIEIMRKLFERALSPILRDPHPKSPYRIDLGNVHGAWPRFLDFDNRALANAPHEIPWHSGLSAEGVYLKGYGVLYSVNSAFPYQEPSAEPKPAKKPLSAWEQTRLELQGVKVEAEQPAAETKSPSLTETLLKVLADNGRNFSHLDENERLTVAITFRGLSGQCLSCHSAIFYPPASALVVPSKSAESKPSSSPNQPSSDMTLLGVLSLAQAHEPDSSNLTLLADLHMKQGRYKEALDAYQKALQMRPSSELYKKLAQASLSLSEGDKHQEAMQRALEYLKQATQLQAPVVKKVGAPSVSLASRLIISAPKKLLDQIGDGKISMEEFKKGVTIQHLKFDSGG